MHTEIYKHPRE